MDHKQDIANLYEEGSEDLEYKEGGGHALDKWCIFDFG